MTTATAEKYDRLPDFYSIHADVKEVARALGITPQAVHHRVTKNQLPPPMRLAGRSYWKREVIRKVLGL